MRNITSIILPVYNRENFLPTSIESVLNQTYKDWELIIVDDFSTDACFKLAEDFARNDKRIKIYSNKFKKGISGARNFGFTKADGKYLAFLDSDDKWLPNHLEDSVFVLEKYANKVDLLTSNALRINWIDNSQHSTFVVNTNYNCDLLEKDIYVHRNDRIVYSYIRYLSLTGPVPSIVAKKSLFCEKTWPEDLLAAEDAIMLLRLAAKGAKLAHMSKTNLVIHIHDSHTSNAGKVNDLNKAVAIYLEFVKAFQQIKTELASDYKTRFLISYRIANIYFWQIAYNNYLKNEDYRNSNKYFLLGLKNFILNPFFWKTYILFIVRLLSSKIISKKIQEL